MFIFSYAWSPKNYSIGDARLSLLCSFQFHTFVQIRTAALIAKLRFKDLEPVFIFYFWKGICRHSIGVKSVKPCQYFGTGIEICTHPHSKLLLQNSTTRILANFYPIRMPFQNRWCSFTEGDYLFGKKVRSWYAPCTCRSTGNWR